MKQYDSEIIMISFLSFGKPNNEVLLMFGAYNIC